MTQTSTILRRRIPGDESPRIATRLKFNFACLSCLGGLILAAGVDTETIPIVAIFFSVFGYVFVDYLKLFALPSIAAYAAMALAAIYCVSDFTDMNAASNRQMVAVAQLLVFVQAILMLQKKTRRIFEQLGVFCLLELIVAAVFNNAIYYGILLVPLGIVGAWALTLLAAVSATEGLEQAEALETDESSLLPAKYPRATNAIRCFAPDSIESLSREALRLPRIALLTLAPAVLLIGAIFFYALPRTTDAARASGPGNAIVGFADQVRLEQIGKMQQSSQTALRVSLTDPVEGLPYRTVNGLYLRGRVLERYEPSRPGSGRRTGSWKSVPPNLIVTKRRLPPSYIPEASDAWENFDSVDVLIRCEAMRSETLFAVAPYHFKRRTAGILHHVDQWTLARPSSSDWIYPRITYEFGSHGFRSGMQTELIARAAPNFVDPRSAPDSDPLSADEYVVRRLGEDERRWMEYIEELLSIDVDSQRTAVELGEQFGRTRDGQRRSNYEVAKLMSAFLAGSRDFQYTLNLNFNRIPGVDPIEQFLRVDRKGHCQYFASALIMMLRSQGIPARMVVGYHTDEFNDLGGHYIARQSHAHAWVEALIQRDQLQSQQQVDGQPISDQYWLRLDPTPIATRLQNSGGAVDQYLDVAQNMWDDYVVDMDSENQRTAVVGEQTNAMDRTYSDYVRWVGQIFQRIRAGELGGGSLAVSDLFSWPAAVAATLATLMMVIVIRVGPPDWIRRGMQHRRQSVARPRIAFYAEVVNQLSRLGIHRQPAQTPNELSDIAAKKMSDHASASLQPPLAYLTSLFYDMRFRNGIEALDQHDLDKDPTLPDPTEIDAALEQLKDGVDRIVSARRARSVETTEHSS